jgi:hypothetical protein
MAILDDLIARFQQAQDQARAANEVRYQQGLELYDRIIEQSRLGTVQKATEATLDRGRTKSVAQGMQSLVSSGLSSTTTAAGLGKQFEEEVASPARLQAEDIASQREMQALAGRAGFIERREDIGPSFGDIANLAAQAANTPGAAGSGRPTTISGTSVGGPGGGFFPTSGGQYSSMAQALQAKQAEWDSSNRRR